MQDLLRPRTELVSPALAGRFSTIGPQGKSPYKCSNYFVEAILIDFIFYTFIRDTRGTFHAKMSAIKDRNGTDLTEAEDIKKRWQQYTEELYKKDLHEPDNHDGVVIPLESDILLYKVKWALGSITMNKPRGGDGVPAELFQILKDDAVKVLYSTGHQICNTQQWL